MKVEDAGLGDGEEGRKRHMPRREWKCLAPRVASILPVLEMCAYVCMCVDTRMCIRVTVFFLYASLTRADFIVKAIKSH